MSTRCAFCLEDLRVFQLVRANCHMCGHKGTIANAVLLQGRLHAADGARAAAALPEARSAGNASLDVELPLRD